MSDITVSEILYWSTDTLMRTLPVTTDQLVDALLNLYVIIRQELELSISSIGLTFLGTETSCLRHGTNDNSTMVKCAYA